MGPLVSVIIPAYNVASYIREAVQSALGQTYPYVEVVVVNDGSTDDTAQAITDLLDRIVYIEQENRGLASARNRGLSAATGDYIALLDGDDVWLPERLERLVRFLDARPDLGFATSDAYVIYGDTRSTDSFHRDFIPADLPFREDRQQYWILQYNFVFVMTVARRQLYERFGGFDETLRTCEDWDMWMRFILGGECVGYIDEPLAYYRVRGGSLSFDPAALAPDIATILERALRRTDVQKIPGAAGHLLYQRALAAAAAGENAEASSLFAGARRDPALVRRKRAVAIVGRASPRLAMALRRLVRLARVRP